MLSVHLASVISNKSPGEARSKRNGAQGETNSSLLGELEEKNDKTAAVGHDSEAACVSMLFMDTVVYYPNCSLLKNIGTCTV